MAINRPKAVFLDKDGTLIRDIPYNVNPDRISLSRGVGRALRRLQDAGYKLFVVSNQSGVARGLFKVEDLQPVSRRIQTLLLPYGVVIDDFFYCPHGPEDTCDCRKPLPGLIRRAVRKYGIDVTKSWMIGDILNDVEAGNRAGCRTILLNNGNETEWQKGQFRTPDYSVYDFPAVADIILETKQRRHHEPAPSYLY